MLEGSILQQLQVAHQSGKRPIRFGVYYKNTLVSLCHALEDSILTASSPPLVIAAFQRGKWYLQEADRYAELAQKSLHVTIMASPDAGFAEHPTSQLPNVDLVGLDKGTDPVAEEWHLIILSPSYTAMVLCQELSAADYGATGVPDVDLERKFYGLWTFEPELVKETVELAIAHIGKYNPELQQTLTQQVEAIAAQSTDATDDLSTIVSRVVDYLQTGQEDLSHTHLPHQQALDNNLVSNEIQAFLRMAQLIDLADPINPMAVSEVVTLSEAIGQMLDLPVWQLKRLRLASLLHRLAPLQIMESALTPDATEAPSCPLIPGAQVLRTMPQLRAVAQIVTHQTERWNGSGYPAALAGDKIPVESRILGLVAHFLSRVAHLAGSSNREEALYAALAECNSQQGHWDPKLVETLDLLVKGMQQGLSLPVTQHKVTTGMWLLDSRATFTPETANYAPGNRREH